jgi:AcrR family transcriptional regulator
MATRAQRKSQATTDFILDAAQRLLAEKGAPGVTLEAISESADVAIQTIYNRVGGKDAILRAVASRAFVSKRDYLADAFAHDGTALERIRRVSAAYVRFAQECPHEFALLAWPPAGVGAEGSDYDTFAGHINSLSRLIAMGIEEGAFDPALNPELTAVALWRLFDGVLSLGIRSDPLPSSARDAAGLLCTVDRLTSNALARR